MNTLPRNESAARGFPGCSHRSTGWLHSVGSGVTASTETFARMNLPRRIATPALAAVTVLLALKLTYAEHQGHAQERDPSASAEAARQRRPHVLSNVQVLSRTIREVSDNYVDPSRVNHQRMFLAGLNAVQRAVAPVLVDYREDEGKVYVQVGRERVPFDVAAINSPWTLTTQFRAVFEFLERRLVDEADLDLRDVEYAAVNGMLRTLDPHTNLLTPEVFENMQASTHGQFGGLGIVISIRQGHLTVIRPIDNTPASRAGLERGDRIVKIEEESTLNMPLQEAVSRLRGEPGTEVNIWYRRSTGGDRWSAPRRVTLVRAIIRIDSVEHRMLADHIGYVKVSGFQGNTTEDLQRALAALHREELRGLVLDLRGNPGGLLDQAVRMVDLFVRSGPIVSTDARNPSNRDRKFAHQEGTEPNYPLVVLINGGSASASEIVAGALKNHDRALILGETSFGKGSVQVLQDYPGGAALKLTIAQYLTPGEVSIQGVGIVPDIAVTPMTVARERIDLVPDTQFLRESDLQSALTHDSARLSQRSALTVQYYLDEESRRELAEAEPEDGAENEEEAEFLIRLAQQILRDTQRTGREEMLEEARGVLEELRAGELAKATRELSELGVDWSVGEDAGATRLSVTTSTNHADNIVDAGEDLRLTVRVTNEGEHPVYRLQAITESNYGLFDERELVFGRINPGETREWTTTLGICRTEDGNRSCAIPRDTMDRADGISISFREAHGHVPDAVVAHTRIRAIAHPQFAYSLQFADDVRGNGDGRLQVGEHGTVYMRVRNVGSGAARDVQANLRNQSGAGVLLRAGRFELEPLEPGQERVVKFTFEVLPEFRRDEAKLDISVFDRDLREAVSETLRIPIVRSPAGVTESNGTGRVEAGVDIRAWPAADAPRVARVTSAGSVRTRATSGGFSRVELADGQPGWIPSASIVSGRGAAAQIEFPPSHRRPTITLSAPTAHVTRDGTIRIEGVARDDQRVRDLYIFVGARKVFYRAAPTEDARELSFSADIPVGEGVNYVTVFARERPDVVGRHVFQVRRDGAAGSAPRDASLR